MDNLNISDIHAIGTGKTSAYMAASEYVRKIPNFETEQLAIYLNRKEKRDLSIVKLFVENGAEILHRRILSNVCGNNHTEIFEYIMQNITQNGLKDLENGNLLDMYLNESDPDEYRPVLRAFDNGHHDMVKILINLGASFTFNDNYLAKKCINQDPKLLEFLHAQGLDLTFDDNYLLFHYVQSSTFTYPMVQVVDYLLKNGADLNGRNHTILSHVSSFYLLDHLTDNYAEKISEDSIEKAIEIFYMNGYEINLLNEIRRLMGKSKYSDSLYETLKIRLPRYFRSFLTNECHSYKLKPEEIKVIIDCIYLSQIGESKLSEILNEKDWDYYIPDYAIDKIIWTCPVKWPVKSLYKAWIKDRVNKDVQLNDFRLAFKLKEKV